MVGSATVSPAAVVSISKAEAAYAVSTPGRTRQ
jgi:hypothetical protein